MSFSRSLLTVSSLTVVSRVGGFFRDTLIAMLLGSGAIADAFFVAQRLPNLFRALFAEGAFSIAFVPIYTTEKTRNGTAAAQEFAEESLALLLAVVGLFSTLVIVFMPFALQIIAPGFGNDPMRRNLAIELSRITFPYLTLVSIAALQGGVLNAHNRFAAAAIAPVILNIVMIAAMLMVWAFTLDPTRIVAWSFTLGGVAQVAALAVNLRRAGLRIRLRLPKFTPAARQLIRNLGPSALGAGAAQINVMVSTILASTLPTGAVSWLSYADRLNQLPLGIIGIAVATILLPVLSRHIEECNDAQVSHYVGRAVEFCLGVGLPAAVGLGLAAEPLLRVLFERGAFTAQDTLQTAHALAGYALGIPAFLLVKVYSSIFFARKDMKTPLRIAWVVMSVNVLGALLFLRVFVSFGIAHVGIALAGSVALWINAVLLFVSLKRQGLPTWNERARGRAPRFVAATVIMAAVTVGITTYVEPWIAPSAMFVQKALALLAILGGSGLAYAILMPLTRAFTLREILMLLRPHPKA